MKQMRKSKCTKIDRRTRNYKAGYKAGRKYEQNMFYKIDMGQFVLLGNKDKMHSIINDLKEDDR